MAVLKSCCNFHDSHSESVGIALTIALGAHAYIYYMNNITLVEGLPDYKMWYEFKVRKWQHWWRSMLNVDPVDPAGASE